MKKLIQYLALAIAASALAACDGQHSGKTDNSSQGSTAGLEAFKTTFYAFANSQGCVKCHGGTTSPYFASSNISTAYSFAKPLLNLTDPQNSIIATYAGNSHCADTPCSDSAIVPTVKGLLQAWADAENAALIDDTPPPAATLKYVTASVALPATLPTLMHAPAVVRFELSQMTPSFPALSGAVLEIEVQLSNATTYRVNRIKIAGNTAAVAVTGVHVFVKPSGASGLGKEDDNQGIGWATLSATAPVFARPNTLPNGPLGATPLSTQAINIEVQSASDMMTIGFENLQ